MSLNNKQIGDGVIKGTLFLTVSTLIVKFLGVIYKIPLSNYLGDEGMGYFNSAYTVFSFFYIICTAGVPKAVMILTGEAKAKGEKREEEKIIKYALYAFLLLGSIMTAALIVFAPLFSALIGSRKSFYTMISVAPSILFVSLAGVIRGKLTADMRFLSISVSQIIEAVGRLSLGLIFAYIGIAKGLSVELVSALTILGVTLGAFFSLIYLYIVYKNAELDDKTEQKSKNFYCNKKDVLKRLFKISVPITLSAAVMSLTNIIDLGLIMRRLTVLGYSESEAAGLYGNYTTLAVSMLNLAISLVTPISVAFLPVFSRLHLEGDREELLNSCRDCLKFSAVISSPIMMGLMFYSEDVLSLIFKNTEIKTGALLLVLLSPSIFFMSALLSTNSLLEASGAVKAPMYSMLSGSIVKIFLCYFLVSSPYFGIFAAPIGTVASYAIALIVSVYIAERKKGLYVSVITTAIPSIVISLASLLLSVPVFDFMCKYLSRELSTIIIILFVGIIYITITLLTGVFNRKELNKIAKYTKIA